MGHARAIINVKDPETQVMLYKQIINYDFSVRKIEEIVRKLNSEESKDEKPKRKPATKFPKEYEQLQSHLSNHFKTDVDFKINNKGKGKIVIPFGSTNDLERIIGILDKLNK
jgi:ParB family chromosome partitioning protein